VLALGHVLASSAIPLFFPPEPLGKSYWGDGCIRLTAPISPTIHLGADSVLAIGIRHVRSPESIRLLADQLLPRISLVDIAGVLLNAVFLDSLETDLERMRRINRTLALLSTTAGETHADHLRVIPVEAVLPSKDLGALAAEEFGRLPRTLRYMLRGLGASDEKGWDLLSYLAFDRAYTRHLLELGRADAHANAGAIRALFDGTAVRRAAA
jgi:NTE family protein